MLDIEQLIQRFPRLNFLKSPAFTTLPKEKKRFLLECIEDVLFWADVEKKEDSSQGFKFLAAHYGLEQAKKEADTQGLQGKAREEFLKPIHDLYLMYNPKDFS